MTKNNVASTGSPLTSGNTISTSGTVRWHTIAPSHPGRPLSESKIEGAVYSYIQAMRAVGKTRVNTAEIASALHLPLTAVQNAVEKLSGKGVRAAE